MAQSWALLNIYEINDVKKLRNLLGVQSTKKFGEWRGAANFYMLTKRSEQRSNSNQTSAFRTSPPLL